MGQLSYNRDTRRVRYDTKDGAVEICTSGSDPHQDDGCISTYDIFGVLGMLRLEDCGTYLLFVTEAELVGERECGEVFRILEVQFVALSGPETCQDVEGVKTLIEGNCFYYSFGKLDEEFVWNNVLIDAFNMCVNNSTDKPSQTANESFHLFGMDKSSVDNPDFPNKEKEPQSKTVNMRFSKKKKITLQDIIDSSTCLERQLGIDLFAQETIVQEEHHSGRVSEPIVIRHVLARGKAFMLVNMFCGYFETQTYLSDCEYRFTIQSIISNRKIGTRLLSRGVDDDGNVSFFAETSFRVDCNGKKEVFRIIRGSVPLFWSQDDPLRPQRVQIDREIAESHDAFAKHFEYIKKRYGQAVVLDLLGHRKHERMLSKLYQDACGAESIPYLHFDINQNTDDFDKLKSMLYAKIRDIREVAFRGEVIFRVNCLDCLDRTNLVEFLIFHFIFPYKFGIINQMWKHNGNALSNFYTGSDALKVELATKGRISVIGRMNDLIISANRMIKNKFSDQEKQRCIDILLGHPVL